MISHYCEDLLFVLLAVVLPVYIFYFFTFGWNRRENETNSRPGDDASKNKSGTIDKTERIAYHDSIDDLLSELPIVLVSEQITTSIPTALIGSSCALRHDHSTGRPSEVWLAGGMMSSSMSREIHVHSWETGVWSTIPSDSEGWVYGSMVWLAGSLIRFGGISEDELFVVGTWKYKTSAESWTREDLAPSSTSEPDSRFNTTLTRIGPNQAVLFGGKGAGNRLYNDLWLLTLLENEPIEWTKYRPDRTGHIPQEREAHSAACLDTRLFIFGGSGMNGEIVCSDNIEQFSLESGKWMLSPTQGKGPMYGLTGGSAHGVESTQCVVVVSCECTGLFNSVYVLSAESVPYQWQAVDMQWMGDWSIVPGVRIFAASTLNEEEGRLIVFGGHGGDRDPKDGVTVLDMGVICGCSQSSLGESTNRDDVTSKGHPLSETYGPEQAQTQKLQSIAPLPRQLKENTIPKSYTELMTRAQNT
jgi:hypothetical protein